jgi:hypothetical protein
VRAAAAALPCLAFIIIIFETFLHQLEQQQHGLFSFPFIPSLKF